MEPTSITSTGFTGALSGNATTATTLQNTRTIGGVSFDGSANIDLPGVNTSGNQDTSGTAAKVSTALNTTTNGFVKTTLGDGTLSYVSLSSADIPDNTADTSGNASTATSLQTARTIGGVSFNGSADIDLPGVNTSGNQDTSGNAGSATILETTRTIGGVSFNGSANIDLPGVNTSGNQDTTGNAGSATHIGNNKNNWRCKFQWFGR